MTTTQTGSRISRRRLRSATAKKKTFWLTTMMLPGAVWLLLIRYLPMFGIVIAFKNYRAFRPNTFWNNIVRSEWVGLKNFEFLNSPDTGIMIRNTLGYNLLWILLGLVISVAFAIMMSELTTRFLAKAYQTMMFFPYFLSWVVASYFVLAFLDPTSGMIPFLQKAAGQKITNFYHDTTWWPLILTICNEKAVNALTTGDKDVDMVFTCSWSADEYNSYAKKGYFLKLDDLIDAYGADLKAAIPESLMQAATIEGAEGKGIYAVNGFKDTATQNTWDVNVTLLNELGYTVDDVTAKGFFGWDEIFAKAKVPSLGFVFDNSSVDNEMAALGNVAAQYALALDCGAVDPETELPAFLSALDAAGMQTYLDEANAQLDAYLAK